MKELIEYLAKNLTAEPKKVLVEEEDIDGRNIIKLHVAEEDMGKIIGKGGRIIKAIRTLLKIRAIRQNRRVYLELVDQDTSNG